MTLPVQEGEQPVANGWHERWVRLCAMAGQDAIDNADGWGRKTLATMAVIEAGVPAEPNRRAAPQERGDKATSDSLGALASNAYEWAVSGNRAPEQQDEEVDADAAASEARRVAVDVSAGKVHCDRVVAALRWSADAIRVLRSRGVPRKEAEPDAGLLDALRKAEERLLQVVRRYGQALRVDQHEGAEIADNTLGIGDLTIGDLRRAAFVIEGARKVLTVRSLAPRAPSGGQKEERAELEEDYETIAEAYQQASLETEEWRSAALQACRDLRAIEDESFHGNPPLLAGGRWAEWTSPANTIRMIDRLEAKARAPRGSGERDEEKGS